MHKLTEIAAYIGANDGFTIIAHISPDGDTLGSSLALLCALNRMGKAAQVVCDNTVPPIYAFLPLANTVKLPEQAEPTPNVVCVDCAAPDRMGRAAALFEKAKRTFNIDHHVTNRQYADFNCVQDMAATGEVVYILLSLLEQMDADIATCLYTALMTDTGNFCYSDTTPDTFRAAARLMEAGANNEEINRRVYRSVPFQKVKLLGRVLSNVRLLCNGELGVGVITQADLMEAGAKSEDVEGVIDHIRDIDTVELALLIRESAEPDTGKVSLRSKVRVDVSTIGNRMNGGGHMHAAGYTDHGPFEAICERAVRMAIEALETAGA